MTESSQRHYMLKECQPWNASCLKLFSSPFWQRHEFSKKSIQRIGLNIHFPMSHGTTLMPAWQKCCFITQTLKSTCNVNRNINLFVVDSSPKISKKFDLSALNIVLWLTAIYLNLYQGFIFCSFFVHWKKLKRSLFFCRLTSTWWWKMKYSWLHFGDPIGEANLLCKHWYWLFKVTWL